MEELPCVKSRVALKVYSDTGYLPIHGRYSERYNNICVACMGKALSENINILITKEIV